MDLQILCSRRCLEGMMVLHNPGGIWIERAVGFSGY
jgi:hypothetical protein